jgi:putative oxidoreductase
MCHSPAVAISKELPTNIALLVLRAVVGVNMAVLHGWDKFHHFSTKVGNYPDPLGMGHKYALILAIVGELVAPVLVAAGLFGRVSAFLLTFVVALNLFPAFRAAAWPDHEIPSLYFAGALTLVILGPGRYALDSVLRKGSKKAGKAPSAPKR